MVTSKITGTGCYIPTITQKGEDFFNNHFLNMDGTSISNENPEIVEKFVSITGIEERRYAKEEYLTSDLAAFASENAIEDAGINREELDYIIVAHNFGDVKKGAIQSDLMPSVATKVKHLLKIQNPNCVAYDLIFGCPGWVEGVIQGQAFIKAGMAKKVLVIGAETLSRVTDEHDRDSMIYSDGAGACILEATDGAESGIISHASQTFANEEANYLFFGGSYNQDHDPDVRYIKMFGRKIYEFALTNVPLGMKAALDKAGLDVDDVKKVFIHQANEKMDEAIIKRFYRLYKKKAPEGVMPMNIHKLGNSSVATVPTLLDMVLKGQMENQEVNKGDIILLASVGAGMNVNAIVYRY